MKILWVVIAFAFVHGFTTVASTLPDYSCNNQSSIHAGQEKCLAREGIHVELPEIDLKSGKKKVKQSILHAVTTNSHEFQKLCRNLTQYQRAMGCAMEVARQCMPVGYRDYLPDPHNVQRMLAEKCNNIGDLNLSCVTSKSSALFDCGYSKGLKHPTRNLKILLCNAHRFGAECQKEVLSQCGCKTARLYVRMSKQYLNPPACSPIDVADPVCHGDSDLFADDVADPVSHGDNDLSAYHVVYPMSHGDSGALQSLASSGLLAVAAVLACWIIM
ncbi:uncharacterized protein LOC143292407 [Babylonia areolata]|uniref:uncharacterized protein LOC143292407 n=1 Tax=Babylonia areolata TaxID=304850 RepID=UPI003FD196F8